jgi:hypothetical protein
MMLGNLKRGNDAEELKLIFNPPYKDHRAPAYPTLTRWEFLGQDHLIIGLFLRDLTECGKLVLLQNKILHKV